MENQDWKEKINDFFNVCQDELKKTTEIGKKMLSASKSNTTKQECYQELGKYICEQVRLKKIELDDPKVANLIATIEKCESELEECEKEVKKIKESQTNSTEQEN